VFVTPTTFGPSKQTITYFGANLTYDMASQRDRIHAKSLALRFSTGVLTSPLKHSEPVQPPSELITCPRAVPINPSICLRDLVMAIHLGAELLPFRQVWPGQIP